MTFDDAEVDGEPGPSGVNLRWTKANHVVWGHRNLPGLDRAVVGLFTREEEVGELHRWDLEKLSLEHRRKEAKEGRKEVLEASETVPEAYREVFGVQSALAKELWRPNEEMERMVQQLEEELGLVEEAAAPKQAGDVVIGVHVRWVSSSLLAMAPLISKADPDPLLQPRRQVHGGVAHRSASLRQRSRPRTRHHHCTWPPCRPPRLVPRIRRFPRRLNTRYLRWGVARQANARRDE